MALDLESNYYQQRRRIVQGALGVCLALAVLVLGCLFMLHSSVHADSINTTDFVTTWKTDNPGDVNSSSITIPWHYNYSYNYDVDWDNDGVFDQFGITSEASHDFGTPGTYTIRIRGTYPYMQFSWNNDDKLKLVDINQWGTGVWENMQESFSGASNLTVTATDAPNLSNVTSMQNMFANASSFSGNLSNWDTSSVTNMAGMFLNAPLFNSDLSNWDTSNVTNMSSMFQGVTNFNSDLSNWDTSNVTNMSWMFLNDSAFNGSLSGWDTSNVITMRGMFDNASAFNQDLSSFDMSSVADVTSLLDNTALSVSNYDATLKGWSTQNLQGGLTIGVGGLRYCTTDATTARQSIIDTFSWGFFGDQKWCHVYINNDNTTPVIPENSPIGTDIGVLGAYDFTPRPNSAYALSCAIPGADDTSFTIGGTAGDHLLTNRTFDKNAPADADGDNLYEVCVRVTNSDGEMLDGLIYVTIASTKLVTGVDFSEVASKKLLTVNGTGMVGASNPNEAIDALTRSLVKLNGVDLPFCSDGFGLTAQQIVDGYGVNPSLVSDDPPCYYLIQNGAIAITETQALIWLPGNFDITAEGTVSVNGSNAYTFNPSNGGPISPTLNVNGDKPIDEMPEIPARPTFSGIAEPGSTIVVTVHSDPVSCSATADSSGNWSCTLPSDLAPGIHTVTVVVTSPDGLTSITLGPYSVTVGGTVTNNTPLAPNTGLQPTIASFARVFAGICGLIVISLIAKELRSIRKV